MKIHLPFLVLPLVSLLGCGSSADEPSAMNEGAATDPAPPAAVTTESEPEEWSALLPSARRPESGLLSGGQPSGEQLEEMRDAGFRTVVNLRAAGEPGARADEIEALGMSYVELPIQGADGLTEANARAFAEILDRVERPAVVHCGSGNRVGALFALKAYYVDGAGVEEAFAAGEAAGMTRLSDAVRRHLEDAEGG